MRLAVVAFLILPAALIADAGVVSQSFEFVASDFVFDKVDGHDVVGLPGQYATSEPGKPLLPVAVYNVVIPADAEVIGVEVEEVVTSRLPGEFSLHPCQRPRAFSLPAPDFVEPDWELYSSSKPFPVENVSYTQSGCLGGFRIAGIQVCPFRCFPSRKELHIVNRLAVRIRYERNRHAPVALERSQVENMAGVAEGLVGNPSDVRRFAPRVRLTDGPQCDMMVITSSSLRSGFEPYAAWKTRNGIKTVVVTTESIYATYPGRDNQEKIRNCVIGYWRNHGLKWLLVGGDEPVVPVRTARIVCEGNTGNIATDLYYADLQYSWDSNHNNLFGEMADSMDLFYDVFVGRAPVDNASNVANFVAKCTTYAGNPDTAYLKSVLFGSTMLFSPFHGRVINRMIAELFPSGWRFAHLEDPPSTAFRDSMSRGCQLGHVAAHGSQTSFSVMSISHISGLSNGHQKLNFTNSIACNSGWFDGYECIAESLVNCRNGGCIANMFNSRYGYGYPPGFGPSEMLDLEFYRYLVQGAGFQFGTLAALCKDHFQSLTMGQEVWRWCVYELNLFGDPSLQVWSERPRTLAVEAPDSVRVGAQVVHVRVLDGGSPRQGALVCLMKGDETYDRGWTNSQGWVELLVAPATAGSVDLTVNARNCRVYESAIPVRGTTGGPALVFAGLRIEDGGNGRLDPGETADLYFSLANPGAGPASNVSARLASPCPHLTIIDSTAGFGTILVGDTVEGEPFRVSASSSTPSGTVAELFVPVTSGEGSWEVYAATLVGDLPPPKRVWLDHDTGNVILSVTSLGSIGTLGPYREGSGMKYPRDAGYGSLYFTSLACGNGPGYVVDRWYGQPASGYNTDWAIVDTLHSVLPPIAADEEYLAVVDDGGHPTPKGLTVSQWSGAVSDPGYGDFVVIEYMLANSGASAINDLHVGVFSDFDVDNTRSNRAFTDAERRLAYMTKSSSYSPCVGIRLLEPVSAANLSAIDSATYRGAGMTTEAVKDSFLRGAISVPSPNQAKNWSVVVSAGPFNLAPGARAKAAFAFVGGESQAEILAHADSAQSWYDRMMPSGVSYLRHTVDDAPPGGNGDGIINPGERVNLPLWVVNRTDRPALGVSGILRKTSSDTLITVTDSVRYFGTVGAGDSVWTGGNGYKFRVAQACTNRYRLPVVLACIDTLDSVYVSAPQLMVGAPQLVPQGIMCWDPPPGGNNNGKLDPGDEADIALGLANIGLGNAANVAARLRSGDARFVVLDSLGSYGMVRAESTVFNTSDHYRVRASSSIAREEQIPCTLLVTGTQYSVERVVMIQVGALTNVDPVPDGPRLPPRYYAYDDCDTFYVAHPEFEWVEIRAIGTRITTSDDQTVPVTLPQGFGPWVFYGQQYGEVSVCSNGWIAPGSTTNSGYLNAALPASGMPPMVCANWDDLHGPTCGGIWHYHDEANRRFIVEYDSIHYYSPRDQWDKFEIIVYDTTGAGPTGDNNVVVQYLTANLYSSSTVGLQDQTGTIAIPCLFDGSYHRAASPIVAGRAIRYTTDSLVTGIAEYRLSQRLRLSFRAEPNPVRTKAVIRLSLPVAGDVNLVVYDIAGRTMRELANSRLERGLHQFVWDGTDDDGRDVSNGVYLYRLETLGAVLTRKAVVAR